MIFELQNNYILFTRIFVDQFEVAFIEIQLILRSKILIMNFCNLIILIYLMKIFHLLFQYKLTILFLGRHFK